MSDCNCKGGVKLDNTTENNKPISITGSIVKYALKFLAFLLLVVMLPILNLYVIWLMFSTLMLNKSVDIKPLLMAIGTKFKEKDEDEEEELEPSEFDELTENDVVLLDSIDITNEVKSK